MDTGVEVEFAQRGRLYLNIETLREMAAVAGLFDALESKIEQEFQRGYDQGYAESVKENHGTAIRDAVERLTFLAGHLSGVAGLEGDEAPEADNGVDLGTFRVLGSSDSDDGAEPVGSDHANGEELVRDDAPRVKKSKPSRFKRPSSVPANRGDDGTLRI